MAELKVIKVAGLDKLTNVNVPLDAILVKGVLKDLVVVDELVLVDQHNDKVVITAMAAESPARRPFESHQDVRTAGAGSRRAQPPQ